MRQVRNMTKEKQLGVIVVEKQAPKPSLVVETERPKRRFNKSPSISGEALTQNQQMARDLKHLESVTSPMGNNNFS